MRPLRRPTQLVERCGRALLLAGSCAALWSCSITGVVAASDDPRDWLARTDQALSTRNYIGVFVHEHAAGESETLRVIHRVSSDGVSERMLSMDGSGREFIRRGNQLTCYLPDQRTVLVEKSPEGALLLGGLPHIDASSSTQYSVKEIDSTRVSGRKARVIEVMPMDELRYGYRVWIDEASAMPLKTQLRNAHGGVLEQIVFTSLTLPAHIADSELEPAIDARNYRWVQHVADTPEAPGLSVSWQASSLPAGFRMTLSARQVLPGGPVEHLVFSDGMASVSVFVDAGHDGAAASAPADNAFTLGSSSAYSTVVAGYRITAVGEVPPDTVRAFALSIRAAAPAPLQTASGVNPPRPSVLRIDSADAVAGDGASSLLFGDAHDALAPDTGTRRADTAHQAFGSANGFDGGGSGFGGRGGSGGGFGGGPRRR